MLILCGLLSRQIVGKFCTCYLSVLKIIIIIIIIIHSRYIKILPEIDRNMQFYIINIQSGPQVGIQYIV